MPPSSKEATRPPAKALEPSSKRLERTAADEGIDSLWEQLLAQAEVEVQRDQSRAFAGFGI